MKVSDAIKALQTLNHDDEIMITWWDRKYVSEWFYEDGGLIDKEKWEYAVDYFASWDLQYTADEITEMITELLKEKK